MARVTVEDCTKIIKNRFELVILASRRAKDIAAGSELTIDRDNDKDPVISLREIAEKTISKEQLTENVVSSFQDRSEYEADVVDVKSASNVEASAAEVISVVGKAANVKVHAGEFAEDNLEVND